MVARAAWLTVEPEISLEAFLASEMTDFCPTTSGWLPDDWTLCVPEDNELFTAEDGS
jgi:hypothetical protein